MRKKLLVIYSMLLMAGTAFCQQSVKGFSKIDEAVGEKIVMHNVAMGETVMLVAKKYKMTPRDIYDYNPDAVNGISANTSLRIPLHRQKDFKVEKKEPIPILALPKTEAIAYNGIKKSTYTDSKEEEYDAAPAVLQPEEVYEPKEPVHAVVNEEPKPENISTGISQSLLHQVTPGETLYSLSVRYKVTLDELKAQNSSLESQGLRAGETIRIPVKTPAANTVAQNINTDTIGEGTIAHKVQQGETLTGLARKYNTTIQDITQSNKTQLRRGLQAGQVLTIKTNASN
ncbi:LysM peptidoglycan-binding domain-containing protein [Flavobacterium rhizosphaerae]|uniref:LysM peptidoglycan-binding domain-containing protein n=1 Tax=Flavobacterium rhizosphaerae TaxID=3163298 RepID=A0ABW8YTZ7_9FLAO